MQIIFIPLLVVIFVVEELFMWYSNQNSRNKTRLVLIAIIICTLPCYGMGGLLIYIHR